MVPSNPCSDASTSQHLHQSGTEEFFLKSYIMCYCILSVLHNIIILHLALKFGGADSLQARILQDTSQRLVANVEWITVERFKMSLKMMLVVTTINLPMTECYPITNQKSMDAKLLQLSYFVPHIFCRLAVPP